MLVHGGTIQDGEEFRRILDHTGPVIDTEVYGSLDHYNEVEIPRGLALGWIRINPDIYTFLIDRQSRKPAGYFNAMPVEELTYSKIRNGEVFDNGISASGVVPFVGNQVIKVYLMSIAIFEEYRHWGEGLFQQAYVQLLTGLLDKLFYYAKNQSIRVSHFLATAWTPEGHKMCEHLGMTKVGCDAFGDPIYEIELASLIPEDKPKILPALRRLVAVYREMTT